MLTTTAEQDLAVEVTQHQTGAVITVRGEVDVLSCPQLEAALDRATEGYPSEVEVDLSDVTFFGCGGATVLARAARRARRGGGGLRVLGAPRLVRVVLPVVALDRLTGDRPARPR